MTIKMDIKEKHYTICSWCGLSTGQAGLPTGQACMSSQIVWVHGHGQCSVCGTNIDECCRGEQCDNSTIQIKDSSNQDNE